VCRLSRDEHHPFTAAMVPVGCVCDPAEWKLLGPASNEVPEVCAGFSQREDASDSRCLQCEHEEACHRNDPGLLVNIFGTSK
jgi:hypothetical protein